MLVDYVTVGGVEVVNHARLRQYLQTVGSPLDSGSEICSCEALTAAVLDPDGLPYTTPDDPDTPAPWWDPDAPESDEFAGVLLLSVDGVDDYPVERSVSTAVTGGGAIGPARVQPRAMTFTALLLGATCCGVEYGYQWLKSALQGCTGSQCGGDCVEMYACCPGGTMTRDEFNAQHRRSFRRVALTKGPRVTARNGGGNCAGGACEMGADIIQVEFTLTAASPFAYMDQVELLDVLVPGDLDGTCVDWCIHPPGGAPCTGCRLAKCVEAGDGCADPACAPAAPPVPSGPVTCFCNAIAVNDAAYALDLSSRPGLIDDVPVIGVYAGSSDLRRLTITLYERTAVDAGLTCAEVAEKHRCEPYAQWTVAFLAAGSELVLDGQTGRAVVYCGGVCQSAGSVFGRDGAPPSWPVLGCAEYCLLLESDGILPPAPDARVQFAVAGKVL
ncbi:hypothetical protein AQJ30_15395 [Streptomyces longwoodensis]|uniref:Uncharacterized protein n=1 Tax=Streptomyces longwoodensis TaxID=68231 RepID=A0A101QXA6_9ACTN|nr:hypothetical protein [Streptomyces longwoodensis]KUN37667.1 hypothetical protein AQJ30_15395 [Streptomyces longwoodensis]